MQERLDIFGENVLPLENWFGDLSGFPEQLKIIDPYEKTNLPLPAGPLQCPYCLNEARINDWLIPKKEGLGHLEKSVQCPKCKAIQRRNSVIRLTTETLENYAQWLYWTAKYDTGRKVKWQFIFERMKSVSNFWEIYRAYKKKILDSAISQAETKA